MDWRDRAACLDVDDPEPQPAPRPAQVDWSVDDDEEPARPTPN